MNRRKRETRIVYYRMRKSNVHTHTHTHTWKHMETHAYNKQCSSMKGRIGERSSLHLVPLFGTLSWRIPLLSIVVLAMDKRRVCP